MEIRKLTAQEIECRVSRANRYDRNTQITLLLYKDARVDQRLLDEIYGSLNWKREHQLIGDRLYCTVSIWDAEKGQWVSKQDVGTESNAEPEKGQASDSFKRACFNFGIGRELYTAPRIVFYLSNDKVNEKGQPKSSFHVYHIDYRDDAISELVIVDNDKNVVYDMVDSVRGRKLMDASSPRWPGMIGAIKAGTYTIEQCKTDFFLSPYYEALLKEILTETI